jgi:hypothetical protein
MGSSWSHDPINRYERLIRVDFDIFLKNIFFSNIFFALLFMG